MDLQIADLKITIPEFVEDMFDKNFGLATKVRILETWRQIQFEELEASLERQVRFDDDPPPKLSPDQEQFKRELSDNWIAPDAASEGVE